MTAPGQPATPPAREPRACKYAECGKSFVPRESRQLYCGSNCRRKAGNASIAAYRSKCPHCGEPIGPKTSRRRKK